MHGFTATTWVFFQLYINIACYMMDVTHFFRLYVWGTSNPRLVGLGPKTDEFGELESFSVEASRLKLQGCSFKVEAIAND